MCEDKSQRPESTSLEKEGQGSQLLFINKDATNLSRTPEELYAIGSHVSKGSRKWKRAKSYLDLDPSTSKILAGGEFDSDDGSAKTTTASSTGKGLKLRWRMLDGRVTSTRTVGAEEFAGAVTKASKSAASPGSGASVSVSAATTATMPPFQSPDDDHTTSSKVQSLLQTYFQSLRPSVFSISKGWVWVEDTSLVLSSPALTYAICAFTSAFTTGSQRGLDKLCLPPEAPENQEPLWPMPEWFRLQAQAISLLRQHLAVTSDPERPIQKGELHAILFLMRLHVMLGNQDAALIHMQAIHNATANAAILPDLGIDVAMWRVNFVLALAHPQAIRKRPSVPGADHVQQEPFLDIDLLKIRDAAERTRVRNLLVDRTILWRSESPQTVPFTDESLVQDHLAIDEGYHRLPADDAQQVRCCLLTCRYLLAYLRYIDADTTLGCVRLLVPDLRTRLSSLLEQDKIAILWRRLPRVMFYMLFAGAFASRGMHQDRTWFVSQLCMGMSLSIFTSYEDVKTILELFLSLDTVCEVMLLEVWEDVLAQANLGHG